MDLSIKAIAGSSGLTSPNACMSDTYDAAQGSTAAADIQDNQWGSKYDPMKVRWDADSALTCY